MPEEYTVKPLGRGLVEVTKWSLDFKKIDWIVIVVKRESDDDKSLIVKARNKMKGRKA